MRCIECGSYSWWHLCSSCQKIFLTPSLIKRKLTDEIKVYSFYQYEEIKRYLHTKHTDLGYHIYKLLAKNSFKVFGQNFMFDYPIATIAIDDNPKYGYSHTAILNHALKSRYLHPHYNILHATNNISYSGKSRKFREQHPREFRWSDFFYDDCILVDDIITTGTTLLEAVSTCKAKNKEVLFCLTLADVRN